MVISPIDVELQDHLVSISPRLFQDARKLMIESLAQQAKAKKQDDDLGRQWGEVRKARRIGAQKVEDLIKD